MSRGAAASLQCSCGTAASATTSRPRSRCSLEPLASLASRCCRSAVASSSAAAAAARRSSTRSRVAAASSSAASLSRSCERACGAQAQLHPRPQSGRVPLAYSPRLQPSREGSPAAACAPPGRFRRAQRSQSQQARTARLLPRAPLSPLSQRGRGQGPQCARPELARGGNPGRLRRKRRSHLRCCRLVRRRQLHRARGVECPSRAER
jgi:hypothetical protein